MISVCIATYNGAAFIAEQLLSIAAQLRDGDEIIVSDDGSTDDTPAIIARLGIPSVRILYNQGEHGYTPNFENALRHATGDVLFIADQDDVWLPGKVETCLRQLEESPFVVSDARIVDERRNLLHASFYAVRNPHPSLVGSLVKFGYLGCCMCFRREVLQKALPFPPNHRLCTHDNWLFLVASCFFHTKILYKPLIDYRRHGKNASDGGLQPYTTLGFKIQYRLYLLYHLLLRCLRRH